MTRTSDLDLSVVIITLNEELNIKRCLQNLPRGSEVVVLDSGSSDKTVEIANAAGAKVFTRDFTNYAEQKNAAIAHATKTWILSVDADEVLDETARQSIIDVVRSNPQEANGYRMSRRLFFMNRRLRFGKTMDSPLRLFRKGNGSFESAIHEAVRVDGPVARVSGEIHHYSYDDLTDYFDRFNNYTSQIAANHFERGKASPPLFAHVLRPWFEFVNRYVVRLGFLDGYPGYCYALLSAFYTFVKYAKLREKRR